MKKFTNKVIWITGASSGYGEALARAFAEEGGKLILSGRRLDKLQALQEQLPEAAIVPMDMTQMDVFPLKVKEAIAAFGQVDLIIHNAAVAQNAMALATEPEVSRQIMDVDYFSHTELTRCILPHFIERKSGHIVVVSGLLAKLTLPGRSSYAAAKAALFGYFGCLRAEMLPYNIDVTILVPGEMQTELVSGALKGDGSISNAPVSNRGCPVDLAAQQSIDIISQKLYEAYVGYQDDTFTLYLLSQNDPNLGVKMLLDQIKSVQN